MNPSGGGGGGHNKQSFPKAPLRPSPAVGKPSTPHGTSSSTKQPPSTSRPLKKPSGTPVRPGSTSPARTLQDAMLIVDSESRASTPTKHLVDEIVATYQQPHSTSDQHPLGMRAASDAVDSEFKQVDLERIGGHLDEWSEFMKKAVLGEISDSLKEYKSRLDSIERQYGGKMTGLKEELTDYRQLNESLKRELNSKEALLENLVVHQVFPISKRIVKRCFQFWHMSAVNASSATSSRYIFSNHVARKHHRRALVRRVLRAWVQDVMHNRWRKRLVREVEAEHSKQVALLRDDYEKNISELTSKVDELQVKLQAAQLDRINYADEMKQALLRGMCALNLETLSVIGPDQKHPPPILAVHPIPDQPHQHSIMNASGKSDNNTQQKPPFIFPTAHPALHPQPPEMSTINSVPVRWANGDPSTVYLPPELSTLRAAQSRLRNQSNASPTLKPSHQHQQPVRSVSPFQHNLIAGAGSSVRRSDINYNVSGKPSRLIVPETAQLPAYPPGLLRIQKTNRSVSNNYNKRH